MPSSRNTLEDALKAAQQDAVERRVFPGCVVGVRTPHGRTVSAYGHHTYDAHSPAVVETTLYDCASLTKSVVTATRALQLLDEGRLRLDDPLQAHVPEYCSSDVRIRHLLTYTVGGVALSTLKDRTADEIVATVLRTPPAAPPGTQFAYANSPAFLLGLALERIGGPVSTHESSSTRGKPLDRQASERIFEPRGMRATTFAPRGAAPTEEGVQDIVHDESARVFARAGRVVGHAGLFSTVPDLLSFLEQLLHNPDPRLETNYLADIGESASLGWELNQPHFMGRLRSSRTFGKTGFTGASIVCDTSRQTAIVILSNRTYPHRPPDASAINRFRSDISDIVFGSL
ncbi:MAG TPA: serine hydrolase domain-containing protein [Candidatus Paceibacterota bacterium]|nr:serine hydrolase domain-containing protein [Candidatus Paceibacterota bacterium]